MAVTDADKSRLLAEAAEDGDDGRALGGVTRVNPFASPRSPLLAEAPDGAPVRAGRPRR